MALTKENYTKRLIDDEIEEVMDMFGAISIEGPKFCGKTWTALNHANSYVVLNKSDDPNSDYQKALINRNLIFVDNYPELLDEWQSIPQLWDDVRNKCDEDGKKGKFILTGSSVPVNPEDIFHSGAGRICKLNMYTMSLYESGDSEGCVSLMDLFNDKDISCNLKERPTLEKYADLIIRGGWPESLKFNSKNYYRLPVSYIEDILDKDINYDGVKRNKNKMKMLLRSLARNESTLVTNEKLLNDIKEYTSEKEYQINRNTLTDYLDILEKIHLIKDQLPYTSNIRSSIRVGKTSKRHFIDPSLACGSLNIKQSHLLNDLELFGFMFESLVVRDLRIYIEHLGGSLYHYRDSNGDEIDAILELSDGEIGAIEIKLGVGKIDEAAKNLIKYSNKFKIKPKFLCVISGMIDYAYKREDGVYVVPLLALKD